mgnify:CR=1 FL=1
MTENEKLSAEAEEILRDLLNNPICKSLETIEKWNKDEIYLNFTTDFDELCSLYDAQAKLIQAYRSTFRISYEGSTESQKVVITTKIVFEATSLLVSMTVSRL